MSGYGVFVYNGRLPRIGYRSGDGIVDLTEAERLGRLDALGSFQTFTLNAFLSLGRPHWSTVHARVLELQPDVPLAGAELRMPFDVADYVDFYSSAHHAGNVGRIFRPDQDPLLPNWRHLPVGYHGRAGTVVVSGTPIRRPLGQRGAGEFGPTQRLDIEAEVGFVVGASSTPGHRLSTVDFEDHVFGVVLVNDWSARDIQSWEYRPLGPFLAKSFATSISPWVVPLSDLAKVPAPKQDPPVLGYLSESKRFSYDITLAVEWNGTVVSRPPFRELYWTPAQQLAHLTVNGTGLRTGDLYASGTVSGPERDQTGSFLELTWGGAEPVKLADGVQRTFLVDGDTVTIRGTAAGVGGSEVDLGEVSGMVRPAAG